MLYNVGKKQIALGLIQQLAYRSCGLLAIIIGFSQTALGQTSVFRSKVGVTAPTRLDWTFAVAKRSVLEPPPEWLHHFYESTQQTYQFYGPKKVPEEAQQSGARLPLILFVSPKGRAAGWKYWGPFCQRYGFLYAGPTGTYKGSLDSRRMRVVMDVLDDVRRRYPVDPDRTYIAGFYGGARIAAKLAYLLPEYFGGVISIADSTSPPEELWLRRQLADRLSVALLLGTQNSPLRGGQRAGLGEIYHQEIKKTGARAELWRFPGKVNRMPDLPLLEAAVLWLEEDLLRRHLLAAAFPSTSVGTALSREEHASSMFRDAQQKLLEEETVYAGLLMLDGVQQRWPDLPEAQKAKQLAEEYEQRNGPLQRLRRADEKAIIQSQIAALRTSKEVDLQKGHVTFPTEYGNVRNWVLSDQFLSRAENDSDEYNETTRKVLKRLGGRVSFNRSGRVSVVDLSRTRVTSAQLLNFKKQLQGMQDLRGLDLSRTVMKESTLRHIADLVDLQALDLSSTKVSNSGMAHFSQYGQLRYLSVASTKVNHRGLKRLPSLYELRGLNLGRTSVDNDIFGELSLAGKLRVLSLAATRIDDKAASKFTALRSLAYLDLSSTKIGDTTCSVLGELDGLERLLLDYTQITDQGVAALCQLTALRELSLLGTRIGDESLQKLQEMRQLRLLNVRSTDISEAGIMELTKATPALQIKWEGNRAKGIAEQKRRLEEKIQALDDANNEGFPTRH